MSGCNVNDDDNYSDEKYRCITPHLDTATGTFYPRSLLDILLDYIVQTYSVDEVKAAEMPNILRQKIVQRRKPTKHI